MDSKIAKFLTKVRHRARCFFRATMCAFYTYILGMLWSFDFDKSVLPIIITPSVPTSAPELLNRRSKFK